MPRFAPLALALSAAAFPALAADQPLPMTYEMFESAVTHTDLETCPESLAAPGRFCRLVMNHHELHVFAFAEDGDQPMVAFASWPDEPLNGLLR